MGLTHKKIGKIFRVDRRTISDIKTGRCWSHIRRNDHNVS